MTYHITQRLIDRQMLTNWPRDTQCFKSGGPSEVVALNYLTCQSQTFHFFPFLPRTVRARAVEGVVQPKIHILSFTHSHLEFFFLKDVHTAFFFSSI